MKKKFIILLSLLIISFASPAVSQSNLTANQILKDLDLNYYYPHQKGLKKFIANISWERRDYNSSDSQAVPGPPAILHWKAEGQGGISRFTFPEQSRFGGFANKDELERFFKNYSEMILPMTLENKFSRFNGKAVVNRGNLVHLSMEPKSQAGMILKYEVIVDANKHRISKVRVFQKSSPTLVTSVLSYIQNGGLWRVAESRSKFTLSSKEYSEVVEFFYKKVNGIWLVSKLRQTILQNDQKLHANTLRFEYQ